MDRFSIIVPMIGDESQFENSLASVLRTRPARSQIIVAHCGHYDDPYDLRHEVDFVQVELSQRNDEAKLAALLTAGIQQAKGRITAMLMPGIELLERWESLVEPEFANDQTGCVCGPIARSDRPKLMAALGVAEGFGYSRKLVGSNQKATLRNLQRANVVGPALAAGFYRTAMLRQIAPLDESLDSVYLDQDIALTARNIGYENAVVTGAVATTDCAAEFRQQAAQPHGRSAQRAAIRHHGRRGPSFWAETCLTIACELLSTPLQPSRFGHALSRAAAMTSIRTDRNFAAKICGLNVAVNDKPLKKEATTETLRRAA